MTTGPVLAVLTVLTALAVLSVVLAVEVWRLRRQTMLLSALERASDLSGRKMLAEAVRQREKALALTEIVATMHPGEQTHEVVTLLNATTDFTFVLDA